MSCVGRFFGILGSNLFFLALAAMVVAIFTNRESDSSSMTGMMMTPHDTHKHTQPANHPSRKRRQLPVRLAMPRRGQP